MPQPLLFTVCERVIEGRDNSLSLIGVLAGANLVFNHKGLDPFIKSDTAAPVNWIVVVVWGKLPDEQEGQEFVQYGSIFTPSGKMIELKPLPFKLGPKSSYRTFGHVPQFPISEPGPHIIAMGLEPIRKPSDAISSLTVGVVYDPNLGSDRS